MNFPLPRLRCRVAKTALVFSLTIVGLSAQTLYWNKLASGLTWATSGNTNWATTASGSDYHAWINGAAAVIVTPSAAFAMSSTAPTASSLVLQADAAITGTGSTATGLMISGAGGSSGSGNFSLSDNATANANLRVTFAASTAGTGFSGTITVNSFTNSNSGLAIGPDNKLATPPAFLSGTSAATQIVMNGGSLFIAGGAAATTATIGALSGTGKLVLGNVFSGNSGTRTLRIDQSTTTAFSGVIGATTTTQTANVFALTKAGSGQLALTGTGSSNAYSGTTTVDAGTLYLAGTFGNSALGSGLVNQGDFLVKTGATLGLDGTFNVGSSKNITIQSGATFAPGALVLDAVGSAPTSQGLVFNGTAVIKFTAGVDAVTLMDNSMTGSAAGGAGSILFDFTSAAPPSAGTAVDLISFGGTSPGIPLDRFGVTSASATAGWNGAFTYGGDGNTLQFVVGGSVAPQPRLLISDTRLSAIRALESTDPLMSQLLAKLRTDAEAQLTAPTPVYSISSGNMLDAVRGYSGRILTAALVYRLDGDPRFLESARQVMLAVAAFPDWDPANFLDTAEMGFGVALGYNWLAADLSEMDRQTIRAALTRKLLSLAPRAYDLNGQGGLNWSAFGSSTKTTNNWNLVCNGGFFAGAMALRNAEPTLSSLVVERMPNSLPLAMVGYDPDGAWWEGPTYWNYGTSYLVSTLALSGDALSTDFGLAALPGFDHTLDYGLQIFGPTGVAFNFGDGGSMPDYQCSAGMMSWLASRFGASGDIAEIRRRLEERIVTPPTGSYELSLPPGFYGRDYVFASVLFPEQIQTQPTTPALNWHFLGEADFTLLRSAADDPNALWIGLKGGSNGLSHQHLDLGSFVFDANGERWAVDLGSDSYSLPGYFDNSPNGQRWTYYRVNNFGHNTLTLGGSLQSTTATAPIVGFNETPGSAYSIVDLTAAYPGYATSIRRGTSLPTSNYILVQDEFEGLVSQSTISWHMLTGANIVVAADGRSATLSKNGKTIAAEVLSPVGAQFVVESAQPPVGGGSANPGIMSLAINLVSTTPSLQLAVRFYPTTSGGTPPPSAPLQPLSTWSTQTAPLTEPAALTATWSAGSVGLNWSASSGAAAYEIKRATTSGGPYTTVASELTGTTYSDTTVAAGTTYYYIVTAANAFTISGASPQATVTTWPAPIITSADSASGQYGTTFSYAITATNNPVSFGATGLPPGLAVDTNSGIISGTPVSTGSYNSTIQASNGGGTSSASLAITVAKAPAVLALSELTQTYNGSPRPVTATTTPSGLTVTVSYDGGAIAPTSPGEYQVSATIDDANYSATASASLVISITALVRHAPAINGGFDGSLQVLSGESIALNSGSWISGDLLVPGMPAVQLNGQPVFLGTIDGNGVASPSNYSITLNTSTVLRHIVRRSDPISMPAVAAPPAPSGTRAVAINSPDQSAGDFATLRDLTLNSGVGQFAIPAGTYGAFTANTGSDFTLGVVGSTTPVIYNFQSLTLNSNSQLQVVGPVIVNLANGTSINANVGSAGHPEWFTLTVASGGVTINGSVTFDGNIVAPTGAITLNGGSTLTGETVSDQLTINSNALLQETPQ